MDIALGVSLAVLFVVIVLWTAQKYVDRNRSIWINIGSIKSKYKELDRLEKRLKQILEESQDESADIEMLSYEVQDITKQQTHLFRALIEDGIDPKVKVVVDGKEVDMKLSKALKVHLDPDVKEEDHTKPKVHLSIVKPK